MMQFLYHKESGNQSIFLKNEDFLHLKVRRIQQNDILQLRNLKDDFLYEYEVVELGRNFCHLFYKGKNKTENKPLYLSLALAIIDLKILEKTLPFLNELGVKDLYLVYTKYSQKNFKIDFDRLERILINSCEQCGRTSLLNIKLYENIDQFLQDHHQVVLVDFDGSKKESFDLNYIYFIGPEGGFSKEENLRFKNKVALKSPFILKSQTAIIAIASKILL